MLINAMGQPKKVPEVFKQQEDKNSFQTLKFIVWTQFQEVLALETKE